MFSIQFAWYRTSHWEPHPAGHHNTETHTAHCLILLYQYINISIYRQYKRTLQSTVNTVQSASWIPTCVVRVGQLDHSSLLKMEAVGSFEMLTPMYQTTRLNITLRKAGCWSKQERKVAGVRPLSKVAGHIHHAALTWPDRLYRDHCAVLPLLANVLHLRFAPRGWIT